MEKSRCERGVLLEEDDGEEESESWREAFGFYLQRKNIFPKWPTNWFWPSRWRNDCKNSPHQILGAGDFSLNEPRVSGHKKDLNIYQSVGIVSIMLSET